MVPSFCYPRSRVSYPSVRPSVHPFVRPSVRPSARPSARPPAHPPARPPARPSVRPSVLSSVNPRTLCGMRPPTEQITEDIMNSKQFIDGKTFFLRRFDRGKEANRTDRSPSGFRSPLHPTLRRCSSAILRRPNPTDAQKQYLPRRRISSSRNRVRHSAV